MKVLKTCMNRNCNNPNNYKNKIKVAHNKDYCPYCAQPMIHVCSYKNCYEVVKKDEKKFCEKHQDQEDKLKKSMKKLRDDAINDVKSIDVPGIVATATAVIGLTEKIHKIRSKKK